MIHRGAYRADRLVEKVAKHIRPNDRVPTEVACDGVYYIGGGYWRAQPVYRDEDESQLDGLRPINPSRTAEEIAVVERAICILTGFEYIDG